MNKNLVDNEHLLKIKSFFKIWSMESFYKELPFYKEIDRINQKNNTSNDLNRQFNFSSYEELQAYQEKVLVFLQYRDISM